MFSVSFENCILDYGSFSRKKMPKTKFTNCSLKEVNFANSNLSGALFLNCNLERAVFNDTQLKSADFSSAYNYTIDPEINYIKKAKFSKDGLQGLLSKYELVIE